MSLIITATDFSEVANHALHYACRMAQEYNASIAVVHSYTIPVTFTENPMPVMPIEESREIAENHMTELVRNLSAIYPGIPIQSHISFGDIIEALADYAKQHQPWLIVVGNSLSDDDGFWFGGSLLSILRNSEHPVMAVPPGIDFIPPKKICFACDYKNIREQLPAADLLKLVNNTKAALYVLNVDHDNREFATNTPEEATALNDLIGEADPQYHYIDNADKTVGIQHFVEENNIDLLVMIPHRHSFFEGLFHKSNTKALAKGAHIPVIALHEKQ